MGRWVGGLIQEGVGISWVNFRTDYSCTAALKPVRAFPKNASQEAEHAFFSRTHSYCRYSTEVCHGKSCSSFNEINTLSSTLLEQRKL